MIEALHFLRPAWLAAVPVWLVLVFWAWRTAAPSSPWERLCDPELLPHVVEGGGGRRSRTLFAGAALAGVLALTALAGPAWRELPQPVFRSEAALVVALDVSRSMQAADLVPSRLVRARHKIRDLLAQRTDGATALVAYAGDAFTVTPLTRDTRTIQATLSSLDPDIMPVRGTRTDRAVALARVLLDRSGAVGGRVLLVSDSVEGGGVEAAARQLVAAGHSLSVLGVGGVDGAPIPDGGGFVKDRRGNVVVARLDEADLSRLAAAGGGVYARYSVDRADLARVLADDPRRAGQSLVPGLEADRWREEGPWLALLLVLGVLPLFRRGVIW